jgi:hypothetical protein
MKSSAFAVVLLLALANAASAQAPVLVQKAPAEPAKAAAPEKTGDVTLAADRLPSSQDPRVCLEFSSSPQVIACAEKYRPRRRPA